MVVWEEFTCLGNGPNLPILIWKYSFDVLSSLNVFFSSFWIKISARYDWICLCVMQPLFDVATVFAAYINTWIVKGTCSINKNLMKNSLKGIISASVFQNRRLSTNRLQLYRAWNGNNDVTLIPYACLSSR